MFVGLPWRRPPDRTTDATLVAVDGATGQVRVAADLGNPRVADEQAAPDLLRTQLSAIAAAARAVGAQPSVIAPMVATARDARQFGARCRDVGLSTVGVTIERSRTPLRAPVRVCPKWTFSVSAPTTRAAQVRRWPHVRRTSRAAGPVAARAAVADRRLRRAAGAVANPAGECGGTRRTRCEA